MALTSAQPILGTSQVELSDGVAVKAHETCTLRLLAPAALDMYIGPSGVALATGYKVPANTSVVLSLLTGERVFAIAASTATCYVLQQRF